MKQLDLAQKLHSDVDGDYGSKVFRALARNQSKAVSRHLEARRINDSAYFLIIFSCFESYVTTCADAAVRRRANRPNFKHRRAWDTFGFKRQKLNTHFLSKVKLILDHQSPEFAKIKTYYDVRNDLAHEGTTNVPFSIPIVVSDIKAAIRKMKR